jgi:hypothetical protein
MNSEEIISEVVERYSCRVVLKLSREPLRALAAMPGCWTCAGHDPHPPPPTKPPKLWGTLAYDQRTRRGPGLYPTSFCAFNLPGTIGGLAQRRTLEPLNVT